MTRNQNTDTIFVTEAERVLSLAPEVRANKLGGYGANSEVIYEGHPSGCPSVLVDSKNGATATFMSNGSIGFIVKLDEGLEVNILDSHFDAVEKREKGAPSGNVWITLQNGKNTIIASLINPNANIGCRPVKIKIVKLGDPKRSMWFCATFSPLPGVHFESAVKVAMEQTPKGPVLVRNVYVKNCGKKRLDAMLWSYYSLHGTQKFVYNKEIWYDCGYPVDLDNIIMTARVPYSEIVQIKRLSNKCSAIKPVDATCDYSGFVGDTGSYSLFPSALFEGKMKKGCAGRKINRFATAAIGANQFSVSLMPNKKGVLQQSLLYVTDKSVCAAFRKEAAHKEPTYQSMTKNFSKASISLLKRTDDVIFGFDKSTNKERPWPDFEVVLPEERTVSEYANSVWTGVKELYENCRAHGARLADGIELGTRDRGQDMWPKMKEDPARIRNDLVYVMSFMYQTVDKNHKFGKRLSLKEKLHGMFPRQYPSRWDNRSHEVKNDNRPYTDSPLWLINSLCMYIRETGDLSILTENVETIALTNPDAPEISAIIGNGRRLPLVKVVEEVLACFERHANDSPYGMAQILYGDWCDPIDMFGTGKVGDASTRGQGRGIQVRLSAHLFLSIVETVDVLASRGAIALLEKNSISIELDKLKLFASRLRKNIVKTAWEDGEGSFPAAFLNCIHELRLDGSIPDYSKGETGYTLGSMKGRDFDGVKRRELGVQAYCLEMLLTKRAWLEIIPGSDTIIAKLMKTVDTMFFDPKLGLTMYTKPMANNSETIALAGRMGVLPVGTAENGEYHHCQVFMHRFRLSLKGNADTVWKQFKPMMSALRDESLCGPFETPSTSYVSDKDDPHFGKGMYFGLSGSVDWIVEVFHKIAGITFALHDPDSPAISVTPNLPSALKGKMTFRRIIHFAEEGKYRRIPLEIIIDKKNGGNKSLEVEITVNNKPVERAEVKTLKGASKISIRIS